MSSPFSCIIYEEINWRTRDSSTLSSFPCVSTAWHSIWSLFQHSHSHQSGWHLEVTNKYICSLTAEHLDNERGMLGTRWVYHTCTILFDWCCAIQLGPTWNPKGQMKSLCTVALDPLCCTSQRTMESTHLGEPHATGEHRVDCALAGHLCRSRFPQAGLLACAVRGMGFPRHNRGSTGTCSGTVYRAVAVDLPHMEHSCVCPWKGWPKFYTVFQWRMTGISFTAGNTLCVFELYLFTIAASL